MKVRWKNGDTDKKQSCRNRAVKEREKKLRDWGSQILEKSHQNLFENAILFVKVCVRNVETARMHQSDLLLCSQEILA